ncbi:MAG TPA: FKBP-type peptidyl-prolyl cis-trans isomerase [Solirubrobacteraceae bacterium]|jgi:peptidylprolyl isomerase|nr:FKBP-type peptidyl-prolyl cis-trans isomerase [Solirubrobacteraceae bacterium]
MTNRTLAAPAVAALALALAGCGSSKAPGIDPAPSAGRTAPAATPTTTTPTTPTTPTTTTPKPTVPLPAAFKTKPTVTIPSGPPPKNLVVKDLIKGTGPAATPTSTVTVQYVGELYKSHKQFDASWNDGSGQPVSFPLSGVIQGWTQGISGMKEGGRRELIIPPSLAYKNVARPGSGAGHAAIPPNSTLVFVIDLHAVS